MKPRTRRLLWMAAAALLVATVVSLVLDAFKSNLVFFYSPSQVLANEAPLGRTFRLGGLVEEGSVKRVGVRVDFVVTDLTRRVPVSYNGILPDLFKEGKGVVAQGRLSEGRFVASEVLAKHDENYMPPEAAEALRRAAAASAANAPPTKPQ